MAEQTTNFPPIAEIEAVFFRAMLQGYASETKPQKIVVPQLPGIKMVEYIEGDFRVVDMWTKTPGSPCSAGWTMIWFRDVPVWQMHYEGWYDDEAIPILKASLKEAYCNRVFLGGRGPSGNAGHTVPDGLYWTYANDVCLRSNFIRFSGHEEVHIFDRDRGFLLKHGEHFYSGMLLI